MTRMRVMVFGGANVDIGGQSARALVNGDSNPGIVRMSSGGVGRNIAENMARLGLDVELVSVFGRDSYADFLMEGLRNAGVKTDRSLRPAEGRTGVYLYICGPDGNMSLAVNDMDCLKMLDSGTVLRCIREAEGVSAVVVDANLPDGALRAAAESGVPLFADAVSTAKVGALRGILGRIHTLKLNTAEAETLSGQKCASLRDVCRAARVIREMGPERVYITMGSRGCAAAREGGEVFVPSIPTEVRGTTGAGDAFLAGLVWAFEKNMDLGESARAGTAAASITLGTADTVSMEMKEERLKEMFDRTEERVLTEC